MRTNKAIAILALVFTVLILMCFTFWINQGRFSLVNRNYFVFFTFIRDMFSYTGLAEVDMTKVTVALWHSGLTNVTPGHVLDNVRNVVLICNRKYTDINFRRDQSIDLLYTNQCYHSWYCWLHRVWSDALDHHTGFLNPHLSSLKLMTFLNTQGMRYCDVIHIAQYKSVPNTLSVSK